MGKGNIDINPDAAFVDANPAFRDLLIGAEVSAAFAKHERVANRAKRAHTWLGLFSLLALLVTMSALIAALVWETDARLIERFVKPLAWLGGLGLAAQIVLATNVVKRVWLGARYAAERLRGIKFQAFEHAALDGQAAALAFASNAIVALNVDLDKAYAALANFKPEIITVEAPRGTAPASDDAFTQLKRAYGKLRVDYQATHARHSITKIEDEHRTPAALSIVSFWLGAVIGYTDLFLTLDNNDQFEHWRQFLTLFFFVLSALLFLLERGRSHKESIDRYRTYAEALAVSRADLDAATDAAALARCIRLTELAVMKELKEFCVEAEHSTYLS